MLTIDVGNTRLKWGVWRDQLLEARGVFEYASDRLPEALSSFFAPLSRQNRVVVCSVASESVRHALLQWFRQAWQVDAWFVETEGAYEGLVNAYQKPQQLGVDRWVAMVAAREKYRGGLCVIDCGTAVTMDIIRADGRHLGGLIMPGLAMMQKALWSGTRQLAPAQGRLCELGVNTADAVFSGCYQLLVQGLRGLVEKQAAAMSRDMLCIITGGDAALLSREFEFDYRLDEDLILYGLKVMAENKNRK